MNTLDDQDFYYDPDSVSSRAIGTRFGLIWGITVVMLGLIVYMMNGANFNNTSSLTSGFISLLSWGIGFAVLILAIQKAKKALGGFITFGKAFATGFWAVLVYTIIAAIWSFVFMYFLAPELMEIARDTAMESMEAQGRTEGELEGMNWMLDKLSNPFVVALLSMFGSMLIWTVMSLIIAAVMRREPIPS